MTRRFWYEQCLSPPQVRARDGCKAGNHGASGVEKPQETRSHRVAPRRKVSSPNRQLPGGDTSKVRCRSRCSANCCILQVERHPQAKAEDYLRPPTQTGRRVSFLVLRSLLRPPRLAPRKLSARKSPASRQQTMKRVALFPARSTWRGLKNRQARWQLA